MSLETILVLRNANIMSLTKFRMYGMIINKLNTEIDEKMFNGCSSNILLCWIVVEKKTISKKKRTLKNMQLKAIFVYDMESNIKKKTL